MLENKAMYHQGLRFYKYLRLHFQHTCKKTVYNCMFAQGDWLGSLNIHNQSGEDGIWIHIQVGHLII